MGGFGSGRKKPHLRWLEIRYHRSRSGAGAYERNRSGPLGMLPSKARRRRLQPGWNGSLAGWRPGGVRGSAEQRRDVSLVRLEPCRPKDRPTASAPNRSGLGLHRFWPLYGRFGRARGGDDIASLPRKAFPLRLLLVVSPAWRIAIYGGIRGCAARAG